MMPFDGKAFVEMPWYEMAYEILKVPIVIFLKLTIPIVDQDLPNEVSYVDTCMYIRGYSFVVIFLMLTDPIDNQDLPKDVS